MASATAKGLDGQIDSLLAKINYATAKREIEKVFITSEYKQLLLDAGYKNAGSYKVPESSRFSLPRYGVYARHKEESIDVLAEMDLLEEKPGISYLSLPLQQNYDPFQKQPLQLSKATAMLNGQQSYGTFLDDLKQCQDYKQPSMMRVILPLLSIGLAFGVATVIAYDHIDPDPVVRARILTSMVGFGVLGSSLILIAGSILRDKRYTKAKNRILSLHPETDPQSAIEKALRGVILPAPTS